MTRAWISDSILPEFERTLLPLPAEDDGELVATLLRKPSGASATGVRRAFLYVHGYVDYFFHEHVATAVCDAGFDFYAVELRRYGRSLRAGNRPNYCTSLEQYFDEISQAIAVAINEDGHDSVVLYGHSTGGLIASLYANSGLHRGKLSAVVLNSPFFAFAISPREQLKLKVAIVVGRVLPWLSDKRGLSPYYGESIHHSKLGEWNYDLRWKPINGFPTYFGWARAIRHGHMQVQRGLSIQSPVLVLHSDASGTGNRWSEDFFSRDIVLDVNDMRKYSDGLGANVKRSEIPGAMHDITLSRAPVRANALQQMIQFMTDTVSGTPSRSTPSFA